MTSRHASEGLSPAALAQTAPLVDLWDRNDLKDAVKRFDDAVVHVVPHAVQ